MSGRVVVGIDGSDGGAAALAQAVDEARLRSLPLLVVVAWQHPSRVPGAHFGVVPPSDEKIERTARDLLTAAVAELPDGLDVAEKVVRAKPSDALLDEVGPSDLLVVGSRGRGGVSGLLLGSTSRAVAERAPCPVLVVPHPADD